MATQLIQKAFAQADRCWKAFDKVSRSAHAKKNIGAGGRYTKSSMTRWRKAVRARKKYMRKAWAEVHRIDRRIAAKRK